MLEALVQEASTPRAVNFGPDPDDAAITVGELATAALSALGADQPWRHEPDPASVEAVALAIDTRLAREALGFRSRLDGPAAVRWTMDWHREAAAGADPRRLCLDQITAYESL
jgi:CDP-glucose 4,6-dehydratase